MQKMLRAVCLLTLAGVLVGTMASASNGVDVDKAMSELRTIPDTLAGIKPPSIDDPQWLVDKRAAAKAAQSEVSAPQSTSAGRGLTYSVQSWGAVTVGMGEFKSQVAATLSDSRGWSRAGVRFSEVPSGGDFIMVLSEANELERRYAPGCSAEYSCRVGPYVIINQDRWVGATPSWNQAGGSLRDYRHMVVNHEVGHWLGHGHYNCSGPGQLAPVMQQQSIDLQGCRFNPWPLESEVVSR